MTKDDLLGRLEGYLDAVEKLVVNAADVASEQVPAVAREIILYHQAVSAIGVLALVLLFVVAVIADRKMAKPIWDDDPSLRGGIGMVRLLCFALWLVFVCQWLPYAVRAWLAPRLMLLEHVSNLMSGV